tara:strand:+ start:324 stop:497 length:174 start_codon:yes stop_codon:yes gene_type:complete
MSRISDDLYYCEWCNVVTDKVADKRVEYNGFDYNACSTCNEIHGFDTLEYLEEVGRV